MESHRCSTTATHSLSLSVISCLQTAAASIIIEEVCSDDIRRSRASRKRSHWWSDWNSRHWRWWRRVSDGHRVKCRQSQRTAKLVERSRIAGVCACRFLLHKYHWQLSNLAEDWIDSSEKVLAKVWQGCGFSIDADYLELFSFVSLGLPSLIAVLWRPRLQLTPSPAQ